MQNKQVLQQLAGWSLILLGVLAVRYSLSHTPSYPTGMLGSVCWIFPDRSELTLDIFGVLAGAGFVYLGISVVNGWRWASRLATGCMWLMLALCASGLVVTAFGPFDYEKHGPNSHTSFHAGRAMQTAERLESIASLCVYGSWSAANIVLLRKWKKATL